MSEKKKKQEQNQSVNAVLFILFWVISLAFLQSSSWDIWRSIYEFVARDFPAFFQRLWVAYLFHGLVIGLGIGLAQKAAIQALSPIRLKYWLRTSLAFIVGSKLVEYLLLRYIDWRSYSDTSVYFFAAAISFQTMLVFVQWLILRKHYKQSWVWLLTLLPTFAISMFGYPLLNLPNPVMFQAIFSALALLWMNERSSSPEKLKNTAEAEARLTDSLPDEDENQELVARFQSSME